MRTDPTQRHVPEVQVQGLNCCNLLDSHIVIMVPCACEISSECLSARFSAEMADVRYPIYPMVMEIDSYLSTLFLSKPSGNT